MTAFAIIPAGLFAAKVGHPARTTAGALWATADGEAATNGELALVWPSAATIAETTGSGSSSVRRHLAELLTAGLVIPLGALGDTARAAAGPAWARHVLAPLACQCKAAAVERCRCRVLVPVAADGQPLIKIITGDDPRVTKTKPLTSETLQPLTSETLPAAQGLTSETLQPLTSEQHRVSLPSPHQLIDLSSSPAQLAGGESVREVNLDSEADPAEVEPAANSAQLMLGKPARASSKAAREFAELLAAHALARLEAHKHAGKRGGKMPGPGTKQGRMLADRLERALAAHGLARCHEVLKHRRAEWSADPAGLEYSGAAVWSPRSLEFTFKAMGGKSSARPKQQRSGHNIERQAHGF